MKVSRKEEKKGKGIMIYQRFRIYGNSKIRERIVNNLRKLRSNGEWRFALIWPKLRNDKIKTGRVHKCVVSYRRYFANVKRQFQNQAAQYRSYYFSEISGGMMMNKADDAIETEDPIKIDYPMKMADGNEDGGNPIRIDYPMNTEYSMASAYPIAGDKPIKGEYPISNDDLINNENSLKTIDPIKTDYPIKQEQPDADADVDEEDGKE